MKKKIAILSCALLVTGIITASVVSADTSETYLADVPAQEREEIIAKKEAMEEKNRISEQEESIGPQTNQEVLDSLGYTEEDMRVPLEYNEKLSRSAVGDEDAKLYVYDKMLNVTDYYNSVVGSFRYENYRDVNIDNTVSYCVRAGENGILFENIVSNNSTPVFGMGDGETRSAPELQTVQVYMEDGIQKTAVIENTPNLRSVESENIEIVDTSDMSIDFKGEHDFVALIAANSRIVTDEEGINTYYYRENLNGLSDSRPSLDPQEMTFGYLSDFSTWEIRGSENVAGRDCFLIEGKLTGGYYSDKLNTTDFQFWVDKETGILIKYINYAGDQSITSSLTTTEISVNTEVTEQTVKDMGYVGF